MQSNENNRYQRHGYHVLDTPNQHVTEGFDPIINAPWVSLEYITRDLQLSPAAFFDIHGDPWSMVCTPAFDEVTGHSPAIHNFADSSLSQNLLPIMPNNFDNTRERALFPTRLAVADTDDPSTTETRFNATLSSTNTSDGGYLVGSPAVTQASTARRGGHQATLYFCNVPGCTSRGFTAKHNLQYHARVHTGERPFVCDRCGRAFYSGSDLRRHQHPDRKRPCQRPE
ncbi:hypothetical protein PM082_005088 [Marasmius tenuissimus]|nr:hypothetical protein PM082_005088 [Marasmius tenuissimus]